jgi:hypothetical protein
LFLEYFFIFDKEDGDEKGHSQVVETARDP